MMNPTLKYLSLVIGITVSTIPARAASRESVIHCFGCVAGGSGANSPLVEDAGGNFYGVATGGIYGQGMIYKLSKPTPSHPDWTVATIYNHGSNGLALTATGGVVVTGEKGGVYELTPPVAGQTEWTSTLITGADPSLSLVTQDSNGIIYGVYFSGHCDQIVPGCNAILTLYPPKMGRQVGAPGPSLG